MRNYLITYTTAILIMLFAMGCATTTCADQARAWQQEKMAHINDVVVTAGAVGEQGAAQYIKLNEGVIDYAAGVLAARCEKRQEK